MPQAPTRFSELSACQFKLLNLFTTDVPCDPPTMQ
jgi:hypothetical protein